MFLKASAMESPNFLKNEGGVYGAFYNISGQ